MLAAALLLGLCATASADNVLFENVRIFDGKGAALSAPSNVLVQGNVIEQISTDPIEAEGVQRIPGDGRTLMPGLIDAHWHAMLIATGPLDTMNDIGFATLAAGDEATDTLMRGFTTVRDVGRPAFGLKRAIDQGIIEGPRIYPSGAMMTVTSGHGDFRQMSDLPRKPGLFTPMEINGG
ncbi:amidohydrolase family protein, partial [Allomesorhizobium alhagi]